MTVKQKIWISFDLGIRGDYENLYAWLDERKAVECGNGFASLSYAHEGSELPEKLKKDLERTITFDKRSRIYVIFRDKKQAKNKGLFIYGSRKTPIWAGYFPDVAAGEDEE